MRGFCYLRLQLLFPCLVRRDTMPPPLLLQVHVTFSYHFCWSLPTDKVQREKAVVLCCFQNTSNQSLALRPSAPKSLLLFSPYLRLCQPLQE